mgnify:CR=1 FL=1
MNRINHYIDEPFVKCYSDLFNNRFNNADSIETFLMDRVVRNFLRKSHLGMQNDNS